MKKITNYLMALILAGVTTLSSMATEAEPIQSVLKQPNPSEPSYITVLSSLFAVIILVFVFVFVYSKISKISMNKLFKGEIKEIDKNAITVLTTTALGSGKTLHVIEVNKKHYLIGATPSSINLISDMPEEG